MSAGDLSKTLLSDVQVANEYGGEKPRTRTQDLYIHMEMKPGLNHKNIKLVT